MKKFFVGVFLAALAFPAFAELDFRAADTLQVLGTLAPDASAKYTRFPDSLKNVVREDLWNLSQNSAGLAIRFCTDSRNLAVRWHSRNKFNMNHMTAAGIRGLDLYMLADDSTWTFVNSARPAFHKHNTESRLVRSMPAGEREFMLYLSLYDGVDSVFIGVDSTAVLSQAKVALPKVGKPIVMYGTSIMQGGCATRPAMAHTNILQRRLNREVINLGFSGNAKLDPEVAHLMAQADASVYVVDPLPNCKPEMVDSLMPNFISILRQAHPTTPILLVESPWFPIMRYEPEVAETLTDKNNRLRAIYDRLSVEDPNLHYFSADNILGDDTETTVDNYHFTDAGFQAFADRLMPVLVRLIGE